MISDDFKIDSRLLNYKEPATNIAWLIQQPEYKITPQAIVGAYMADYRAQKKEKNNGKN